jgi:hypothetical protein
MQCLATAEIQVWVPDDLEADSCKLKIGEFAILPRRSDEWQERIKVRVVVGMGVGSGH